MYINDEPLEIISFDSLFGSCSHGCGTLFVCCSLGRFCSSPKKVLVSDFIQLFQLMHLEFLIGDIVKLLLEKVSVSLAFGLYDKRSRYAQKIVDAFLERFPGWSISKDWQNSFQSVLIDKISESGNEIVLVHKRLNHLLFISLLN